MNETEARLKRVAEAQGTALRNLNFALEKAQNNVAQIMFEPIQPVFDFLVNNGMSWQYQGDMVTLESDTNLVVAIEGRKYRGLSLLIDAEDKSSKQKDYLSLRVTRDFRYCVSRQNWKDDHTFKEPADAIKAFLDTLRKHKNVKGVPAANKINAMLAA